MFFVSNFFYKVSNYIINKVPEGRGGGRFGLIFFFNNKKIFLRFLKIRLIYNTFISAIQKKSAFTLNFVFIFKLTNLLCETKTWALTTKPVRGGMASSGLFNDAITIEKRKSSMSIYSCLKNGNHIVAPFNGTQIIKTKT